MFISEPAKLALGWTDTELEHILVTHSRGHGTVWRVDRSNHLKERFSFFELPCGLVLWLWTEARTTFIGIEGEPIGDFICFRAKSLEYLAGSDQAPQAPQPSPKGPPQGQAADARGNGRIACRVVKLHAHRQQD